MMETKQSQALRVVGIVLMGSTAAMNILGGIGTVCAAFLTKDFPPMWALLDYQWLYQSIMILTIIVGLVGTWATIRLARGGVNVYRDALILLAVGSILAGIQMFASLALRGKAVPANMKFYINLLTLIYFLALRLPGLRGKVDFGSPADSATRGMSSGLAAIVAGAVTFTTSIWVGSSHIYDGNNWVHVLRTPLLLGGIAFIGLGMFILGRLTAQMAVPSETTQGIIKADAS
jgi:hypothetical protein